MPAPQSALLWHCQLGTHWCVVGWQKLPGAQSSFLPQVEPLPPAPPGWQEWRLTSHVIPPEQSAFDEQKPASLHTPAAASQKQPAAQSVLVRQVDPVGAPVALHPR
jgi:hypothetical protein